MLLLRLIISTILHISSCTVQTNLPAHANPISPHPQETGYLQETELHMLGKIFKTPLVLCPTMSYESRDGTPSQRLRVLRFDEELGYDDVTQLDTSILQHNLKGSIYIPAMLALSGSSKRTH